MEPLDRVLRLIAERADASAPAPTNGEIIRLLGARSISVASLAIRRLEKAGAIRVERFSYERRITVVSTGRSTAAPKSAIPHWTSAAKSKQTRRATFDRAVAATTARALDVRRESQRLARTRDDEVRRAAAGAAAVPLVDIIYGRPAEGCRWPKPNYLELIASGGEPYCGKRRVSAIASYCPEHQALSRASTAN